MRALKIGITLFLLLAIVAVSSAQTARVSNENTKLEKMIAQLGLNEDQASKVREIRKTYAGLVKGAEGAEQKKAYKAEADVKIQGVLTAEQYTEYKKILSNQKRDAAMKARRKAKAAQ